MLVFWMSFETGLGSTFKSLPDRSETVLVGDDGEVGGLTVVRFSGTCDLAVTAPVVSMTLDEMSCVVVSTATLAADKVVLVLASVVLLPKASAWIVVVKGAVLINGVVGGSNAPLLNIDTVVPNDSSESNASTKSLAEYTLTLPGLTSKLAKVGRVEGTVSAGSVVVSGEDVVEIVELKDSVVEVPFSVTGVVLVILSVVTDNDDGITACVVVLGFEVVVSTETIAVVVDGNTVVVKLVVEDGVVVVVVVVLVVGTTVVGGGVVRVGMVVLGMLVVVSVTGLKVDDINLASEERVSCNLEPNVGAV